MERSSIIISEKNNIKLLKKEYEMFKCDNPEKIAKEIFWLAWNACKKPVGMGYLQDKPTATKEDVWNNIQNCEDYPRPDNVPKQGPDIHADYVFGRMMKLSIVLKPDGIILPTENTDIEYQAWSRKYKTYEDLFNAAIKMLKNNIQKNT